MGSCGNSSSEKDLSDSSGGIQVDEISDQDRGEKRGVVGKVENEKKCPIDRVVVLDSGGMSREFSINNDCYFDFILDTNKVYSLRFYLEGQLIATLFFHNGINQEEYFYLSPSDSPLDLGIIAIDDNRAIPSRNPSHQNDADQDGQSDFIDTDDDNDDILDNQELDCDQDNIRDDYDDNLDCVPVDLEEEIEDSSNQDNDLLIDEHDNRDSDEDGVIFNDNCPEASNPFQEDQDIDGIGDHCDDSDLDGIFDYFDNCPSHHNPDQSNIDQDPWGDACDWDSDDDGIGDDVDNCIDVKNFYQNDADSDGLGDVCDIDPDNDGVLFNDNCPLVFNPGRPIQRDSDIDGLGDACDFVKVVSAYDFNCALRRGDGKIICWGQQTNSRWVHPTADINSNFVDLAADGNRVCGIKSMEREVLCWGNSDAVYDLDASYDKIDLYGNIACALSQINRGFLCWYLSSGDMLEFPGNNFNQIFSKIAYVSGIYCGVHIQEEDNILCWSSDNDDLDQNYIPPIGRYSDLAAADDLFCAIRTDDGSIICWGENIFEYSFEESIPNENFSNLLIEKLKICALKNADGVIHCWSRETMRSIKVFSEESSIMNSRFISFSFNGDSYCGIKEDKKMYCWGENGNGKSDVPQANNGFRKIYLSNTGTCAIKEDASLIHCWGDIELLENHTVSFEPIFDFSFIGNSSYCFIAGENRDLICNGWSSLPEADALKFVYSSGVACHISLPEGRIDCDAISALGEVSSHPIEVENRDFLDLAISSQIICAIRSEDDSLICWRRGDGGDVFFDNKPDFDYNYISAGSDKLCAIYDSNQNLICWDFFNGNDADTFRHVRGGFFHKVSLSPSNSFYCYIQGFNRSVQCVGSDLRGRVQVPDTPEFPNENYVDISVSNDHACAIKEDGRTICWGSNGPGAGFVPAVLD